VQEWWNPPACAGRASRRWAGSFPRATSRAAFPRDSCVRLP
jgi:hypothetical protein